MSVLQAETMVGPQYVDPRYVYAVSILYEELTPPPKKEYVVLGIFRNDGHLLEEVLVYIDGQARSKHLYCRTACLFWLPILREITSFGLYIGMVLDSSRPLLLKPCLSSVTKTNVSMPALILLPRIKIVSTHCSTRLGHGQFITL
jgi:hypothetical protein